MARQALLLAGIPTLGLAACLFYGSSALAVTWSLQTQTNKTTAGSNASVSLSLDGNSDLNSDLNVDQPGDGSQLLGRYGLTASDVFKFLTPQLAEASDRVSLRLNKTFASHDTVHELYQLWFGSYPVEGAYLSLHHHQNKLTMLRYELPEITDTTHLPQAFTASDFIAPAALGFTVTSDEKQQEVAVVLAEDDTFIPAWRLQRQHWQKGESRLLLIDARTGRVIRDEVDSLHVTTKAEASAAEAGLYSAKIYPVNPDESSLTKVNLTGLLSSNYLDGNHFKVYGSDDSSPRPKAKSFFFDVDASADDELDFFDQVSAYHGATRAYDFFASHFDYDLGTVNIPIYVGSGKSGNAAYYPNTKTIVIGPDNQVLFNLARDTDVIAHEFSHYVVAETLTSRSGEAGILHEGYADYFAYAMSGDPHLAKSTSEAQPYLRTAALPEEYRFDSAEVRSWGFHNQSQIWSAMLWRLRREIGDDKADQMVFASLRYLGSGSGFQEAFLALLNADRDFYPVADGDTDHGVYGENKCTIFNAGVDRGFAVYLGDFDGSSCGLDLTQLARESRDNLIEKKPRSPTPKLFGQNCAVIQNPQNAESSSASQWPVMLLLLLPLLLQGRCLADLARRFRSWI